MAKTPSVMGSSNLVITWHAQFLVGKTTTLTSDWPKNHNFVAERAMERVHELQVNREKHDHSDDPWWPTRF